MRLKHIFLDLDGVLSDFHSEYGKHTKEEWKIEFPKFVRRGGFENLNMLSDAQDLMGFINELGIPITILSSAGNFPDLYPDLVLQKHLWLRKHNIRYPALVVPRKECKADYAQMGTLLIDDQGFNTHNFMLMGGYAITHVSAETTINRLKDYL